MQLAHATQLRRHAACFLLFVAVVASSIFLLNGFAAEFSGPDEAAHLVSGIMVRQYLIHGLPDGRLPLDFAREYYEQYPKVAIGHWPPVFYIVQSLWYCLAGLSRTSVMLLSILIAALLGSATTALCRTQGLNWPAAIAAGLLVVLSPQVLGSTLEFSSDPLVALLVFLATIAAAQLLQSQDTRSGLLFALLASAACLTKGNAFPLLLLPFLILLVRRDLTFVRPMALILLLVLPWYWLQRDLLVHEIVPGATSSLLGRIRYSAIQNARLVTLAAGPVVLLLALSSWRSLGSISMLSFGFLPAVHWIFLSFLSPHVDSRLMIAVIPAFCFFAAIRLDKLPTLPAAALCLFALASAHFLHPVHAKPLLGFVPAVAAASRISCPVSLVVSNHLGEGAWISELALHQPVPNRTIRRASKLFQRSSWMGEGYRVLVDSSDAVSKVLDAQRIDCLIMHKRLHATPLPYQYHVESAIANWQPFPLTQEISLYRRPAANNPIDIR